MLRQKELQAIATLNQWGVPFLASPRAEEAGSLDLPELLRQLIQSESPRLKLGATAFFLVHPEKAPILFEALSRLDEETGRLLKYYYTAAVYLQRMWLSQLTPFSNEPLPDYFSGELRLPSPVLLHGRIGLASLEEALQQWMHQPYNYKVSFESLIRILQERARSYAAAGQS